MSQPECLTFDGAGRGLTIASASAGNQQRNTQTKPIPPLVEGGLMHDYYLVFHGASLTGEIAETFPESSVAKV